MRQGAPLLQKEAKLESLVHRIMVEGGQKGGAKACSSPCRMDAETVNEVYGMVIKTAGIAVANGGDNLGSVPDKQNDLLRRVQNGSEYGRLRR
jgi:hypothetical protein